MDFFSTVLAVLTGITIFHYRIHLFEFAGVAIVFGLSAAVVLFIAAIPPVIFFWALDAGNTWWQPFALGIGGFGIYYELAFVWYFAREKWSKFASRNSKKPDEGVGNTDAA